MRYARPGIAFDYPDSWTLDAEDSGASVTVYAPEGGFWSLTVHPSGDAAALSDAVVAQMREEYRDLDCEAVEDGVDGCRLTGFDMNFYCLDLTNTSQVRTLETPGAAYLLFCQAEDREWDRVAPVFAAMTASFVRGLAGHGERPRPGS